MSTPTVSQLDTKLKDLIKWGKFATYLPGLTRSDIQTITVNNPLDVDDQKLALFDKWLRACPKASWGHVITALESAGETALADKLKGGEGGGSCTKPPTHQPSPITCSSQSDVETSCDVDSLRKCVKDVFTENFAKLKSVAELNMDDLAAVLYSSKIIPSGIKKNPTFDGVMDSFKAGLQFKKTKEAISSYCKAFLNAFDEGGGPLSDAAGEVREEIVTKVRDKLGVVINLS